MGVLDALDITISAQEQSLTPLIGRGAGEIVTVPLKRTTGLSETTIKRIGAGADIVIDKVLE